SRFLIGAEQFLKDCLHRISFELWRWIFLANVFADCLPDVSSFMNQKAGDLTNRPLILAPIAQGDDDDDFAVFRECGASAIRAGIWLAATHLLHFTLPCLLGGTEAEMDGLPTA